MSSWSCYILKCSDGSFYTGVTTDIEKRLKAHNEKRGAKYTKSRTPVTLVAIRNNLEKGQAYRLERTIKRQRKRDKIRYLLDWERR